MELEGTYALTRSGLAEVKVTREGEFLRLKFGRRLPLPSLLSHMFSPKLKIRALPNSNLVMLEFLDKALERELAELLKRNALRGYEKLHER